MEDLKFIGVNHGKNQLDLRNKNIEIECVPIEIHLKENGTIDNKPTFAILMKDPFNRSFVGQISLKMFNEGLNDIGYEIIKK